MACGVVSVTHSTIPVDGVQPLPVRHPPDGVEGCCFDGGDLVLTNEAGRIFRISAQDIHAGTVFAPPTPRPGLPPGIPTTGSSPRAD